MRWLVVLLLAVSAAGAGPADFAGETAGDFDYYVLSLSWSPNWCALEGDARGAEQCDTGRGYGWSLHGLWPQYETGWPSFCSSRFRNPPRTATAAMADIMGSGGLAWYQWKKHGRCSGLSPENYFARARAAYAAIRRPAVFRRLLGSVRLPASVVEQAFLAENETLAADMITITCKSGAIQEARICLTRELNFRTCGSDVVQDCTLDRALMEPVR